MKQENQNTDLYHTLLKATKERRTSLWFIKNTVNQNWNRGLKNKHKTIDKKLNKLSVTKIGETQHNTYILFPTYQWE